MMQRLSLGLLLLSSVSSTAARQYRIEENKSYNASNFFDKFEFITTGDPNNGYVDHQSRSQAEKLGLAKIIQDQVYLGVEHETVLDPWWAARKSLRLESRDKYNKGLVIIRYTHLPKSQCGSWPAVWTLGEDQGREWPKGGEIDIYEGWNNQVANQHAVHVGLRKDFGECTLDTATNKISSSVITSDCDNMAPDQPGFSGCQVRNGAGDIWGNPTGGTQALEWTDDYIKIYTWRPTSEPLDIDSDAPDTSGWGTPSFWLSKQNCNLSGVMLPQKLIINLNLCGSLAYGEFWTNTQCDKITNYTECKDWVAKNPHEFAETYFQIRDIRVFKERDKRHATSSVPVSTAVSTTVSTTVSTSVPSTQIKTSGLTLSVLSSTSHEASSLTLGVSSSTSVKPSSTTLSVLSSTSIQTTSMNSSAPLSTSIRWSSLNSSAPLSTSIKTASMNSSAPSSTSIKWSSLNSSAPSTTSIKWSSLNSSAPLSTSIKWSSSTSSIPSSTSKLSSLTSTVASAKTSAPISTSSSHSSVSTLDAPSSAFAANSTLVPLATVPTLNTKLDSSSTSVLAPQNTSMPSIQPSTRSTTKIFHPTTATAPRTQAWSNSSMAAVKTVTVYSTSLSTITSCPPSVTDCATGKVEQVVVPWYTTPVQVRPTRIALQQIIVHVYTITRCPVTVANCPLGQVATVTECAGPDCQASTTAAAPVSGNTVSGNTVSGNTVSGNTVSSNTVSDNTVSGNTRVAPVLGIEDAKKAQTITREITSVHTITSCPPTVTSCTVGAVSTEIITATACPGRECGPFSLKPQSKPLFKPLAQPGQLEDQGEDGEDSVREKTSQRETLGTSHQSQEAGLDQEVSAAKAPSKGSDSTTFTSPTEAKQKQKCNSANTNSATNSFPKQGVVLVEDKHGQPPSVNTLPTQQRHRLLDVSANGEACTRDDCRALMSASAQVGIDLVALVAAVFAVLI